VCVCVCVCITQGGWTLYFDAFYWIWERPSSVFSKEEEEEGLATPDWRVPPGGQHICSV
jgi:hypothetical protein